MGKVTSLNQPCVSYRLRSIAARVPSTVNNKQLRWYGIFFQSIKALQSAKRFKIASANRLINFNYLLYLLLSLSLSLSLYTPYSKNR